LNGEFPRVYRLRRGWRNTFVGLGAIFAVGGIVGALFAGRMSEFFAGQVVMAVVFSGFALLGVFTMLGMLRTRVVLHAETIELHGVFSNRSLWRPDIAGRRLMPMQYGPPVIRLVPRAESPSRPIVMPQFLETDSAFEAWVAAIPDIDAQEATAALDALLADPAIPGSEDEKLAGLARARRIAQRLRWLALGVAGWLWIYPHPYDLAVLCGVAVPWLAVIVAARGGPLYKINGKDNDASANLLAPVITPGFALLIRAMFDTQIFDWQDMLLATIAATAVIMLVMWWAMGELRASASSTAVIALLMVPYAYGALALANRELDASQPAPYVAKVLGSHISSGKTTSYYLKLGPWGPRNEAEDVDVGREYYGRGSRQETVCVYLFRGALGIRWFEVWDCPRE
jgi:hypothetical protein